MELKQCMRNLKKDSQKSVSKVSGDNEMPELKKNLEIRMGASFELQKTEDLTLAIVPQTFDLVDDFK